MSKRIEIIENSLVITDTITNVVEIDIPKDLVYYNNTKLIEEGIIVFFITHSLNNNVPTPTAIALSNAVNSLGVPFSVNSFITFAQNNLAVSKASSSTFVNISNNDIGLDAWGRPKVILDTSIFHGMFSHHVPMSLWYERINNVVQTSITNSTSVDGALQIQAGAALNNKTNLRSYRNPRYEPNRGFIYSTSAFIENPNALMNRSFGTATEENGAFFRLESGTLYGVVRTTRGGSTTEDKVELDTIGIDLSKGNIFDIQYQWRGVGNYKFFINLKLVGSFNYLGSLSELSMSNPANPLFFESENLGDNNIIRFGCVDVSSEGGKNNGKTYGSIGISNQTGSVPIIGYNVPVLVVRSKAIVDGKINTRDAIALLINAYSDSRSILRVWHTRDATAITLNNQTWTDFGDGHLEYIVYDFPDVATPMTFNTAKAKLAFGCRVGQDVTYSSSALFDGKTEIYQTPSDIFIFTMHRENGIAANVGVTYEFAEQI